MAKSVKNGCVSIAKAELFERIHARTGLPKTMLKETCTALLQEIEQVLMEGNQVALTGFGTFDTRLRKKAYNISRNANGNTPEDDRDKYVGPQYSIKFTASRFLTTRLRKEIAEYNGQKEEKE